MHDRIFNGDFCLFRDFNKMNILVILDFCLGDFEHFSCRSQKLISDLGRRPSFSLLSDVRSLIVFNPSLVAFCTTESLVGTTHVAVIIVTSNRYSIPFPIFMKGLPGGP